MRAAPQIFEGTLTTVSQDALVITLRNGSTFTISPTQLERSEVLSSRTNVLRSALVGGGVGLGVGVALVVTHRNDCSGQLGDACFGRSFEPWNLILPPAVGFALGGLVGRFIRTPAWVPGFLPGAAAAPGDFALSWSLRVTS